MTALYWALIAYLIGSISFAVLVSRAFGLPDPRTFGSKNPGATNVLRTGRKAAALLTLLGDGAKGWLAVFLAERYAGADPTLMTVAGVAVVVGHMWPLFFRFYGGKGVSTAAGVLFGFSAWLAVDVVATWLVIAGFFRISSLAALIAAASAQCFALMLFGVAHQFFWGVLVVVLLLIWRHRQNIRNLLAGTEGRLGRRDTGFAAQDGDQPADAQR